MMAGTTSDKAAAVRAITSELKLDEAEREAIRAEATDGEPAYVQPPDGVWEGTLFDLFRRDIPKPEKIATLAAVPVVESAKVVLYGQPSSTKTLLAFRAALSVALEGGDVWILEGEGHEWYFRNRLERIARGIAKEQQLDWETALPELASRIRISHKPFVLEQGQSYWRSRLAAWRPRLVLIDPLIDYTAANENDAKEMRAYLRLVQIATDQFGCAAIVCHHSTKPTGDGRSRERGSGSIKGWADVQISVAIDDEKREPGKVVALVRCEKGRDLASRPEDAELTWRFEDDHISLEVSATAEGEAPGSPQKPAAPPSERTRTSSLAKRTTKVIELLSRGPMAKQDIKNRTGWGGRQLNEVLEPLLLEDRVHISQAERTNAKGATRLVDVYQLGPAPPVASTGARQDGATRRDPETGSDGDFPASETTQPKEMTNES